MKPLSKVKKLQINNENKTETLPGVKEPKSKGEEKPMISRNITPIEGGFKSEEKELVKNALLSIIDLGKKPPLNKKR